MQSHVKNIFENLILQPAIVSNRQNELLYFNSRLKNEFGFKDDEEANKAVNKLIEDPLFKEYFDKFKESSEQSEFIWSGKISSDEASLNIKIRPLNLENEEYLIAFIERSDQELQNNYKFSINASDVKSYVENNSMEGILNKLKSSFPFTFIGKQKFQRDIDSIQNKFWIKDVDQNIIIANNEFASSFGKKISQIQSTSAKKLYKELDLKALQSAEGFLLNSSKPVIIDISSTDEKNNQEVLIELPLIDIDKNIVAIVGFSDSAGLTESAAVSLENKVFSKLLKNVNLPFLLIDIDLKIVNYNDQFSELFLQGSNDNSGQIISDVLTGDLLKKIDSFVESGREDLEDYIEENDGNNEKLQMLLSKVSDGENELGYFISFDTKLSNNKNDLKDKMYDIIMQTSPEPIFIYDIENLKFIEVNKAALSLYGYSREEFLDMDLTDLYAPEDIQTLIESSQDKSSSSDFTGPWRHRHKNGSTILVEISKSTLEHQGKKAHFNMVRVVTDILEEKKLLQSFKSVYENSSDPVFTTDKEGFISSVNNAALKLLHAAIEELKNKSFLSLVSDDYRVKVNTEIFHANLINSVAFDLKIKLPGGKFVDANIIATPILNYNSEVSSFTIIISLKSKAVDGKSADIEHAEVSDKLDKTFLAHLFHELLTPVNVIVGFTRELSESIKNPNEEQKESVEIINDNQKLLLQIMDNAVEYSSIEQDEVELNIENLTFVEVLDDVEDNVKKFSDSNNVDFSYGKVSSSLKFETDRAKLISLLTMWIKFAIKETDRKKIYLSAYSAENDYTFISINDERSALSKELFEALQFIYSEEEGLVKQKHGISRFTVRLARKLINVLGGKKEVVYKGGDAVEFGFKFPMTFTPSKFVETENVTRKSEEVIAVPRTKVKEVIPEPVENSTTVEEVVIQEPVREAATPSAQQPPSQVDTTSQSTTINVTVQSPPTEESKQAASVVEPEPEQPFDFKDMTCLYVEDQVDSQILFKVQMKGMRSIEYANSFEKALPMIESRHFDFIVMDINLQGEYNGLDALRAIQKMPGHDNIPIIAVTAYVLPGDREKFIAAGFSDFITKPILRDKLEDILKKMFT